MLFACSNVFELGYADVTYPVVIRHAAFPSRPPGSMSLIASGRPISVTIYQALTVLRLIAR